MSEFIPINNISYCKNEDNPDVAVIHDGKRYNPKTAELIAYGGGYGYDSDWYHWWEAIYRTTRGKWFLYGQGNGLSSYGNHTSHGRGPGNALTLLTDDEAYSYLEEHANDELEELTGKHFPDRTIEDG